MSRTPSQLVLTNSRVPIQVVSITSGTTVWKEVETSADIVVAGDFLYVSGLPPVGGTVQAIRMWVNIGWYHGTIAQVGTDAVQVNLGLGSKTIYMTPITLIFQGASPPARFAGQLKVGQRVDALGVFVPGADMRATRVWVA